MCVAGAEVVPKLVHELNNKEPIEKIYESRE
jgi:hypothetical protein